MANGLVVYLASGASSVSISGQTVSLTGGGISVSGSAVYTSGQQIRIVDSYGNLLRSTFSVDGTLVGPYAEVLAVATLSGSITKVSGQVTVETGNTPRTQGGTVITALSGGTTLANIPGFSLLLRNLSGNGTMMVGTNANPPNFIGISGIGIPLYGGEQLPLKVTNANKIQVLAGISGQTLAVFMTDF